MRYGVVLLSLAVATWSSISVRAAEPMDTVQAVSRAADWLVAHQLADGGWSVEHGLARACDGKCDHPGVSNATRNAASALAVLALLSAGQGEKDARHKRQLASGLAFLSGQLKERVIGDRKTHTFEEGGGTMYSHGLATLALCEGFRVTGDMALREPAQKALDHIVYSQDPVGGGWRYVPRQPGDTSVSGWQITALVSGRDSMLEVWGESLSKADRFLETMQADDGARYGYVGPGMGLATTAIGLSCRRRLGWKADRPAFKRGVEILAGIGPSKADLYFDFYATQALRQADDASWKAWEEKMSRILLDTQVKEGHAAGSWHLPGDHGAKAGGRVYCTTMAAIILGVEHGKLPIMRKP